MQTNVTHPSTTEAVLTVIATEAELTTIKKDVLGHFQNSVKVPGFRAGKIPEAVLEKHVDPNAAPHAPPLCRCLVRKNLKPHSVNS